MNLRFLPKIRTEVPAMVTAMVVLAFSGCCKKAGETEANPTATSSAVAPGSAASIPGSGGEAVGTVVEISAGTLVAGTPCQQVPRITNEELEGTRIEMGAFSIDAYPYPNDPAMPPKTGVTREEGAKLCEARGRRLCTELEWERACKGPSNTMYPYGSGFKAKTCEGSQALVRNAGSYDSCASAFGAKALFGAVWEWTASDWGRGGPGGFATVRGGGLKNPTVQTRCANGQGKSPAETAADLGFRCCGGPQNSPSVNLSLDNPTVLVPEASVDSALAARLLAALPGNMRSIPGYDVSIDRIWRWHPRANEEMIAARYAGKKTGTPMAFYNALVFHLCGNTLVLSAKLRGPVERLPDPGAGADPQEISLHPQTKSDTGEIRFSYRYGSVVVKQPDWVKEGTTLDVGLTVTEPPRIKLRLPAGKR